ncbi:MAG: sulfotransferase family 2 domain-containing protein [Caulobacter sp.]|nr:sulfotransferase family 2 domain-containing protein [Caulobacter sp.]
MSLYSERFGFIFVMNPRTGCTATAEVLTSKLGAHYVPGEDRLDEKGRILVQKKHTSLRELQEHNILTSDQISQAFKFVTIRNPFDSLYSLWAKKKVDYVKLSDDPNSFVNRLPGYREDMDFIQTASFSEWIRHRYGKEKRQSSVNLKYITGVNMTLRFETLQQDFSRALRAFGADAELEIPLINKTAGRQGHYREQYDPAARTLVEQAFKRELDLTGYGF